MRLRRSDSFNILLVQKVELLPVFIYKDGEMEA
jgi:hypothetical protein